MECAQAFLDVTVHRINDAYKRIEHCLSQLNEDDMWYRPHEQANNIGILLQHLSGNLRQWVIDGVTESTDTRNRPREFRDDERPSKAVLALAFAETIGECRKVIGRVNPDSLLTERRIQGSPQTVMSALYAATTHLDIHAGQIMYITRVLLKDEYKIHWIPQTKEEGAEK